MRQHLLRASPSLDVQLVEMTTEGDRKLDTTLASLGGKGLFLKELEHALLDKRLDIAVHSMKDVTVMLPDGLHIAAICERASPYDALVSNHFHRIDDLPQGARVGTCSLRRSSLLLHYRPDLRIMPLRGNVNSRLQKLDNGDYEAIILAEAGLRRLGFSDRIRQVVATDVLLPAVGQGAVGVECRRGDGAVETLLASLNDEKSAICVQAERATNRRLEGGCHAPIAVFAQIHEDRLLVEGRVMSTDGVDVLAARVEADATLAEKAGIQLAEDLLAQGAATILHAYHSA